MLKLELKLCNADLLPTFFLLLLHTIAPTSPTCIPPSGCSVALGNYIVSAGDTIANIATTFQSSISSIEQYNQISDINSILPNQAISVPFPCACSDGQLGYSPEYSVKTGDTIDNLVQTAFSNLSQTSWVLSANGGLNPNYLTAGFIITIPLNCSCGNPDISTTYGLFLTYVIQPGDTLTSLSQKFDIQAGLLTDYNGQVDFSNLIAYSDIIFVPAKDGDGVYPPFNSSAGNSTKQVSGINKSALIGGVVGGAVLLVLVFGLIYWTWRRKGKHVHEANSKLLTDQYQVEPVSSSFVDSGEKVIEFTFEQLAESTDNFSISKIIGAGGFGTVYYAEIDKKRVAIKMMDIKETQQFKAELQVLARVHHTNLVELVGCCIEKSLFLVYEFVENGTLRSHLEAPEKGAPPLNWASRVQIALDSARGLEYIHEYTVPSYVHRDIKPDNILLDNSLRAKVADFGLAKLGEITGTTKNAGTRGYMAPEYALGGIISPKVDVYAFGVVLMQLVSAKSPIVFLDGDRRIALNALFDNFLKEPDAKERLIEFVDPTLKAVVQEDNDTQDSVWKMAQLACECTHYEADLRPDMKNVVARITSLVASQEWVFSTFNLQAASR